MTDLSERLDMEYRLLKEGRYAEAARLCLSNGPLEACDASGATREAARRNALLYEAASSGLRNALTVISRTRVAAEGRSTYGPDGTRCAFPQAASFIELKK